MHFKGGNNFSYVIVSGGRVDKGNSQGRIRIRHPRKSRIKIKISNNNHRLVLDLPSRVMGGNPPRRFALETFARLDDPEEVELFELDEEALLTRASLKKENFMSLKAQLDSQFRFFHDINAPQ
jgi:hypothetical protein